MKNININFFMYLQDYVAQINNLLILITNKLLLILNRFIIILDQILYHLDNYTSWSIEIIYASVIMGLILFSGKVVKEIIDTTAKVIGIGAGSTIIYNNWIKNSGSGGSSNNDDNNENRKNDKDNTNNSKNDKTTN